MANPNLATPTQQNNPGFDRVFAELGFAQPTPFVELDIREDEPEETDRTDWEDFLGYHEEARR